MNIMRMLTGGELNEKREVGFLVTEEYISWINEIKEKIKRRQIKASVRVNAELLDLYWSSKKRNYR